MYRVELEQVSQRRRIRQVVDGHEIELAHSLLQRRAKDVSSDPPETIDCDLDRHMIDSGLKDSPVEENIACTWRVPRTSPVREGESTPFNRRRGSGETHGAEALQAGCLEHRRTGSRGGTRSNHIVHDNRR